MAFSLSDLNVKVYSPKWILVEGPEPLDEALLDQIKIVQVTQGEWGNSLKIDFKSKDFMFLDLDDGDSSPVGEIIPKEEITIVKLQKGEQTCFRARTHNFQEKEENK